MSSDIAFAIDTPREAVHAITEAARLDVAEGIRAASRRLLVEVLRRSENVGLREYRLSSLLHGDIGGSCAALWSLSEPVPALARGTGRGWRMDGTMPATCDLHRHWFLLSMPVMFEGDADFSLVLLDGEADGLHRRDEPLPGLAGIDRASVVLERVFLREDEIITSQGTVFVQMLAPFAMALRCAVLAGACLDVVERWDDSPERDDRSAALTGLARQAAETHEAASVVELLSSLQRHARALSWWPLSRSSPVGAEDRVRLSNLSWL